MNTVQYIFCGMKVLIYKLQGRTASKLVRRMWFLRLRKVEPLNFLQEIRDFKHYRHTGDKKRQLRQTDEQVFGKVTCR
jgi:hypothetical protein